MLLEDIDYLLMLLSFAVLFDLLIGEPPALFHPVVWMGKVAKAFEKLLRRVGLSGRSGGILLSLFMLLLFTAPVVLFCIYKPFFNRWIHLLVSVYLLKSSFAIRALREPSLKIARAIKEGNLDEARVWIPHLVRRDPAGLDRQHLLSAVVESVAESTVDGFTSTIFFFFLFGLQGAVAFRVINTLDSMVGYRTERYIRFGWFPARLDDIANWIPARLTGLLMIVAAFLAGADSAKGWTVLIRDRRRIPSPNSGWTESAMAGVLRVQLEEKGHHILGDDEKPIEPYDVVRALEISSLASFLFTVLIIFTLYFW